MSNPSNNLTDFTPGMKVASREFPDEKGTVERIDEDENMVWVRFPTSRGTHLVDLDPNDLLIDS